MKQTLLGIFFWSVLAGMVVGVAGLLVWLGVRLTGRVDWKLVKSLVTWLAWLQLLWSVGAWFRAKARKA